MKHKMTFALNPSTTAYASKSMINKVEMKKSLPKPPLELVLTRPSSVYMSGINCTEDALNGLHNH